MHSQWKCITTHKIDKTDISGTRTTFIKSILMLYSNWIFNRKILVKIKRGLTTFECINAKFDYQWHACPKANISLPIEFINYCMYWVYLNFIETSKYFLFLLKVVSTFSPSSLHGIQYPQGSTHLQAGRLTQGLRNSQIDVRSCLYISF